MQLLVATSESVPALAARHITLKRAGAPLPIDSVTMASLGVTDEDIFEAVESS